MLDIPAKLADHLKNVEAADRSFTLIQLDQKKRVLKWYGNPAAQGLIGMKKKDPIAKHFDFLADEFPQPFEWIRIPFIERPDDTAMDVDLFANETYCWLICTDSTDERNTRRDRQQRMYDLRLLLEQWRIMDW